MILSCQGISKSFGEKVILEDASFHIEEREKAALIGNNGAGKTTLLRLIMNELHADSGQVVLMKDKQIGYLAQYQDCLLYTSVPAGRSLTYDTWLFNSIAGISFTMSLSTSFDG